MNLVSISQSVLWIYVRFSEPGASIYLIFCDIYAPTHMITDWQRYLCDWQNNLKVFCTCVTSHVVERSRFPCNIFCRYEGAAGRYEFDVLRQGGSADWSAAEEMLNNDSEIDLCTSFVGFWFEGLRVTAVVFSLSEHGFWLLYKGTIG